MGKISKLRYNILYLMKGMTKNKLPTEKDINTVYTLLSYISENENVNHIKEIFKDSHLDFAFAKSIFNIMLT